MNNPRTKKSYIKPELSSLGNAVELTLTDLWKNYSLLKDNYSHYASNYSHNSKYDSYHIS